LLKRGGEDPWWKRCWRRRVCGIWGGDDIKAFITGARRVVKSISGGGELQQPHKGGGLLTAPSDFIAGPL